MQIILNGEPFELEKASESSPASEPTVASQPLGETGKSTQNVPDVEREPKSIDCLEPTVASLVLTRQLNPRQIAVEVNCQLIPREDYEKVTLREGDQVEVVTLAGGG